MRRDPVLGAHCWVAPVIIGLIVLEVFAFRSALAQSGDADGARPPMEEIIVTARRRAEPLAEVPLSLTVFSATELDQAQIRDVDDLALFTPGFSFEKGFGRQLDRPVMRGMSTILSGTQIEQNVAFYLDGIYVSGAISALPFFDIERVELLKGPQNALFGRAAFAGAVNFVTRKPDEVTDGRITATVASHDQYEIAGHLSGPLIGDRLTGFLGASYYRYGGEYLNRVTDKVIGGEETGAFSAALRYRGDAGADIIARVTYTKDDDEHYPVRLQDSSFNNCFLDTADQYYCGEVVTFDQVELNTDAVGGGGLNRDTWRASLIGEFPLDGLSLTSTTAYNHESLTAGLDQDFTGRQPIEFFPFCPGNECLKGSFQTLDLTTFEDVSQEFRLASEKLGALTWQMGAYFFSRRQGGNRTLPAVADKPVIDTRNLALFAQADYRLSPDWTLSGEIRVAGERKKMRLPDDTRFKAKFGTVNPRVTLSYSPEIGALYYATVARGSKPGGFNARTELPDDLKSFEEENTWNYEVGIRRAVTGAPATVEASFYYIDWSRQQLTSSFERTDGSPIIFTENAGKTRVLGLEFAGRYVPSPWTELTVTYAYNNAEFRRFDVAEQAALTGDPSVRGNRTPRAPRHMASASATLAQPVRSDVDLFLRTDLLYESKRFAQVHNFAHTGDRVTVNMKLGLRKEEMELSLWVKNLFENRTAVSIIRFRDFAGLDSFTAPRAFGIVLPRGRQVGATATARF